MPYLLRLHDAAMPLIDYVTPVFLMPCWLCWYFFCRRFRLFIFAFDIFSLFSRLLRRDDMPLRWGCRRFAAAAAYAILLRDYADGRCLFDDIVALFRHLIWWCCIAAAAAAVEFLRWWHWCAAFRQLAHWLFSAYFPLIFILLFRFIFAVASLLFVFIGLFMLAAIFFWLLASFIARWGCRHAECRLLFTLRLLPFAAARCFAHATFMPSFTTLYFTSPPDAGIDGLAERQPWCWLPFIYLFHYIFWLHIIFIYWCMPDIIFHYYYAINAL